MSQKRLGVAIMGSNSAALIEDIERAEAMGLEAAWLTTGGANPDAITVLAAAAVRTERIMLGTAITPTFPRNPVAVAQQVQVLGHLAPGRFRLGVGPSGRSGMEEMFGVNFRAPLGHLSEFLLILRGLLHQGSVDFDGSYYKARARIAAPMDIPVMASALGEGAFKLCGAESDGAISWVCPRVYLRDVALPAMRSGAEGAGAPVPPMVAHAPVCVHDNPAEVRDAVRQQFGVFPRAPFYQRMFVAAGFPEATQGAWSDGMVDGVAISGGEAEVAHGLRELYSFGATEILASPVAAGSDPAASLRRTMGVLAEVSKTV